MSSPFQMGKPFMNPWRLGLLSVFCLSICIYLPAMHGKPVWEDVQLISGDGTGGQTLAGAFTHSFLAGYYRPLTSASFLLDRAFADHSTFVYHLFNVFLHAFTAVLCSWLALLVTRKPLAAILAGVFFAVQPAQLGATAWIGGRTDALSLFFIALFLNALVMFHLSKRSFWVCLSAVAFLLAVLSKEQSFALLPAVPLSFYVFGSRKGREALAYSLPFAAAGAVLFALSRLPGKEFFTRGEFLSYRVPILTAADYGSAFLFPTHQSQLLFSLNPLQSGLWIALGLGILAAGVWLAAFLWQKHRPLAWVYLCGLLLYLPVSNVVAVPSFWVSPYRLSETGLCLACLCGAAAAFAYSAKKTILGFAMAANLALGVAVVILGVPDWCSGPRLNAAILKNDPAFIWSQIYTMDELAYYNQNAKAMEIGNQLLTWLLGTPKWETAVTPQNEPAVQDELVQRLHTNFGKPEPGLAAKVFSRQVQLLLMFQRNTDAFNAAREGLCFAPLDSDLNYQYGLLVMATNRADAMQHWARALTVDPSNVKCSAMLGHELLKDGRYGDAEKLLARAASGGPAPAFVLIALCEARIGLHDYPGALQALDLAGLPGSDAAISAMRSKVRSLMAQHSYARLP